MAGLACLRRVVFAQLGVERARLFDADWFLEFRRVALANPVRGAGAWRWPCAWGGCVGLANPSPCVGLANSGSVEPVWGGDGGACFPSPLLVPWNLETTETRHGTRAGMAWLVRGSSWFAVRVAAWLVRGLAMRHGDAAWPLASLPQLRHDLASCSRVYGVRHLLACSPLHLLMSHG